MRGMNQAVIDMLPLYKKYIESCVLDEARQGAMKGWKEGSKKKLRKKNWRLVIVARTPMKLKGNELIVRKP